MGYTTKGGRDGKSSRVALREKEADCARVRGAVLAKHGEVFMGKRKGECSRHGGMFVGCVRYVVVSRIFSSPMVDGYLVNSLEDGKLMS